MKAYSGVARRLLLGALLMACAASALPQAPSLYTVEIVVFRSASDAGAMPGTPPPAAADVTEDNVEATVVPTGKLTNATTRLRGKTSGFRVLVHTAWTQSPTAWPDGSGWNSGPGVSATQLALGNGITGKVFLKRNKYLSLGLDLIIEDNGRRYRINEVRRMVKSGQIQYFDHPAVGVLAIITPTSG